MRAMMVSAATLVVLLTLAGCQRTLMETPLIFADSGVDPLAATPPEATSTEVPVFIATNRKRYEHAEDGDRRLYANLRAREQRVRLARATVSIGGRDGAWNDVRGASLTAKRPWSPPIRLESVHEYGLLWTTEEREDFELVRSRVPHWQAHRADQANGLVHPESDAFISDINALLARSEHKDLYVFVHGFNTAFDNNTELAAALWHFLGREGAMISYEWPSRHSMFAYSADKAAARASVLGFRLLLMFLNKECDAERIHIIAHSAGSPVVVTALQEIRLMTIEYDTQELIDASKVGQVVLAAPDMDVNRFGNAIWDAFDQIPEHVTIYVSSDDGALGLSTFVNGFARLGHPIDTLDPEDLQIMRRSDTISVVDVALALKQRRDALGHSYFHANPWVSSDLFMILRHGAKPEDRGLYREPDGAFWLFPQDYAEVGPERARGLWGE